MDGAWKGQIDAYFEQNQGRFDEIARSRAEKQVPTATKQELQTRKLMVKRKAYLKQLRAAAEIEMPTQTDRKNK